MIEFVVKIPEEALPVIELAAGEEGWTPDSGISAVAVLFRRVVDMARVSAVNARVRARSAALVDEAEAEISPLITAWLEAQG